MRVKKDNRKGDYHTTLVAFFACFDFPSPTHLLAQPRIPQPHIYLPTPASLFVPVYILSFVITCSGTTSLTVDYFANYGFSFFWCSSTLPLLH